MIMEINESKTLTKHISRECKCKFDDRKCNTDWKWNEELNRCECKNPKNHHVFKKNVFAILVHALAKMLNV